MGKKAPRFYSEQRLLRALRPVVTDTGVGLRSLISSASEDASFESLHGVMKDDSTMYTEGREVVYMANGINAISRASSLVSNPYPHLMQVVFREGCFKWMPGLSGSCSFVSTLLIFLPKGGDTGLPKAVLSLDLPSLL